MQSHEDHFWKLPSSASIDSFLYPFNILYYSYCQKQLMKEESKHKIKFLKSELK